MTFSNESFLTSSSSACKRRRRRTPSSSPESPKSSSGSPLRRGPPSPRVSVVGGVFVALGVVIRVDEALEEEWEEVDDAPEEVAEGGETQRLGLVHAALTVDVHHLDGDYNIDIDKQGTSCVIDGENDQLKRRRMMRWTNSNWRNCKTSYYVNVTHDNIILLL